MHLAGSTLQLAAYDLGRFLCCRHCTALDMEVANGDREEPHSSDPFLEMLRKRGREFEKEYIESIETGGNEVIDLGGLPRSEAAERLRLVVLRGLRHEARAGDARDHHSSALALFGPPR